MLGIETHQAVSMVRYAPITRNHGAVNNSTQQIDTIVVNSNKVNIGWQTIIESYQ